MARPKALSDPTVLAEALRLHAEGGAKLLTFGNLARATGLAPSTLAQRYGTVEGLAGAAAQAGWRALLAASDAADQNAADKGPQGYLKALDASQSPHLITLGARDETAKALSAEWRGRVETALALRLGQGEKARQAAQILFASWQGQLLWGGKAMKIKDLAKRLI